MDRFFLYYEIGAGENAQTPELPGIKHSVKERVVSIPVNSEWTIAGTIKNTFETRDPQAGRLVRDFQELNGNKKEFRIWKSEVKTNIPTDQIADFVEEKGNLIVNIGILLLGIYAVKKLFIDK